MKNNVPITFSIQNDKYENAWLMGLTKNLVGIRKITGAEKQQSGAG